jgi:hypothetical protein
MFKQLLSAVSFSVVALVGAKAGETHIVNGDLYYIETEMYRLGGGRFKHILKDSLFNSSDPNVYFSHIRCNGDGDGDLSVTSYASDGVYIIDDDSDNEWRWEAAED